MPDAPPGAPQVRPPGGPGQFSRRTDSGAPAQTIRVPTGEPYGKAKQLEQAEQSVALPDLTRQVAGSGAPAAAQAPSPGGGPVSPSGTPGSDILSLLSHPTQRPDEPITAGTYPAPQPTNVRQLLSQMAASPGAPESIKRLASEANAG